MNPPDDKVTADARALAEAFHDAYERLAPSFGYTTRTDTRKFDPDSPNGKLMQAVVAAVVGPVVARAEAAERERDRLCEGNALLVRDRDQMKRERDQLRAEVERLTIRNANDAAAYSEAADKEIADLRAQLAAAQAQAREANGALLEYLPELAAAWNWKRNSTPSNNREMAELDAAIDAARREGGAK